MDSRIEFVYYTKREKATCVNFHRHECYEIVYYLRGAGSTVIGGKEFKYSSNTYAVICPHCYHNENHCIDTDVMFIGFKYNGAEINLDNGIYSDDSRQSILHFFRQIMNEISGQKKFFRLKVDLILNELLIELERLRSMTSRKCSNLSYIKAFIEENYNQRLNLKTLSQMSGYSYDHFRHLFKKKTGFPPVRYLINQRIANAKRLLKQKDISILEISQECGFYNESQFSSMFKKMEGTTPGKFRKTNLYEK